MGYLGQFYFVGLFGQRVVIELRRKIFQKLLALCVQQRTTRRSGDLLSRFTSDVAAVEQGTHVELLSRGGRYASSWKSGMKPRP